MRTKYWFDLIHYVPSTSFPLCRSGLPGLTGTKLGLMRLAQGHNAMAPVRLEAAATRYRVKHSTTEPLRSEDEVLVNRFFKLAQERCG